MIRRRLLAGLKLAGLAAALALAGCGEKSVISGPHPKELVVSIPSGGDQAALQQVWQPLLDDLSASLGVKVKPAFASNYTSLVEAMRFGQSQLGWFAARPALEAVNRADAQVLVRLADAEGDAPYRAVLVGRKGARLKLDEVLKCGRKLSFGSGEAEATSDALAPMTYLFIPNGVDPVRCFRSVRSGRRAADILAVASGGLDLAAVDTASLAALARERPQVADKLEAIWASPPLPQSAILVRKDLDPAIKEKIRQFLLTYGAGAGPQAERQRAVLARMGYGGFRPADEGYLDPIREMTAAEALAAARRSGDRARIAAAQAEFDKVQAAAAQRRAANPDI